MTSLVILVIVAAAGFTLARWLNIPVIPPLVILGFLLAHSGLPVETTDFDAWLNLGLAFLVYTAGIELSPQRFRRNRETVVWTAVLQFVTMSVCGFGLAMLLGFGYQAAAYLGCALATSSTLVVVRTLQRRRASFGQYGRLVIGVLLVQDLAIILVIVLLLSAHKGLQSVALGIAAVIMMAGAAVALQRWVFKWLLARRRLEDEVVLLIFIATLFVFAGVSDAVGLPWVAGAFFAGLALSAFPVDGVARSLLSTLSTFFLAVFFTSLGAYLPVPSVGLLLKTLPFIAAVLLVTPPLVAVVGELKGKLSSSHAITGGLMLAQTSEFSIVLALLGFHLDRISSETMTIIILVAVVTMTLTPILATDRVAQWLLQFHPLWRRRGTDTGHRDHVLLIGLGAGGMWAVRPLREAGHNVVVIDHDPAVLAHLQKAGVSVIHGDGSDEKMLKSAGFDAAKLVLIGIPDIEEVQRLLAWARPYQMPKFVRVFEEFEARRVEAAGGIAVLNSHAAVDTFMEWLKATSEGDGDDSSSP